MYDGILPREFVADSPSDFLQYRCCHSNQEILSDMFALEQRRYINSSMQAL